MAPCNRCNSTGPLHSSQGHRELARSDAVWWASVYSTILVDKTFDNHPTAIRTAFRAAEKALASTDPILAEAPAPRPVVDHKFGHAVRNPCGPPTGARVPSFEGKMSEGITRVPVSRSPPVPPRAA